MEPIERAAYIISQAACAQIEAAGMIAENQQRAAVGASMAFPAEAFDALIDRYGISHNAVMTYLRR